MKKKWLLTRDWSKYTILDPVMEIPNRIIKKLPKFLMRAYLSFYFRPKFLWDQFKRRNFLVVKKVIKATLGYPGI